MSHRPSGSEYYKGSDGNLQALNHGNGATLQPAPTPYFKLQTPGKLLSKSNITFNSQSKLNQSQLSLSKS